MTSELSGTTVLVTGGTSGIGRAAAVALAGLGAHVVLAGRDETRGSQVVQQIRVAGGQTDFLVSDLHDEASARSLAARARDLTGQVDVLVNNAGVFRSALPSRPRNRNSTRCSR
jgi:NAD(P)-dependent dehydrogenase (short-subunit alcohol dehydrogenase family)